MTAAGEHDTQVLLDRIRQGDASATQALLDRHRGRLRRMVQFRMDDRMAARVDPSDVVQEALIVAHNRLSDFLDAPQPGDFYPWLRRIAWSRLLDLHRRHVVAQRRTVLREVNHGLDLSSESATYLAQQLAGSAVSAAHRLAQAELIERVKAALHRLSEMDREVLTLRFLEQLSVEHAAQVVGISCNTFKARQLRAIARLRDMLDREDHEATP